MTRYLATVCLFAFLILAQHANRCLAQQEAVEVFQNQIKPILANYCYDCHGEGMSEGSVAFDEFESGQDAVDDRQLWSRALKMLRTQLMPPVDYARPSADELAELERWIKTLVFKIDPENPDPGRVTLRRLNRAEYRNTIRDLLGVDYNTDERFPPDDTGHGFDNIGDVLTTSTLHLEKYLAAAEEIVGRVVPTRREIVAQHVITGQEFRPEGGENVDQRPRGPLWLSYYVPAWVSHELEVEHAGSYELVLNLRANEQHREGVSDFNRCRFTFQVDDQQLLSQEFSREEGKPFHFRFPVKWQPGSHRLTFELEPLTPDADQVRKLSIRVGKVTVQGPLEKEHWTANPEYRKFFTRDVPTDVAERRVYARQLLGPFATRAYRRPMDEESLERLTDFAEGVYSQAGQTFEEGIAEAMTAVLVSPRFLFRVEEAEPADAAAYPFVDEYSLASRLSYFLWSTMPDETLFRWADKHKLRENLPQQINRMMSDPRCKQFVKRFAGQWLHARDVEYVQIQAAEVISRDEGPDAELPRLRRRLKQLKLVPPENMTDDEKVAIHETRVAITNAKRRYNKFELVSSLRQAMLQETEMHFEYIFRNDRSLLEFLDCDYAFLNARLARHYGIEGIEGDQMRLVSLPADSPRGGVLTQGAVLATTSNPNRTSPVKRGLFILENLLGIPPAPPPPNIPALEDPQQVVEADMPTLRQSLAKHREDPSCSSCHDRMDPLGLAMENFNALGVWREQIRGKRIDASGQMITGESFTDFRQLKQILVENRRRDFYRCLAEKMLAFAIGRGLEYYDVHTVDTIVDRLEEGGGKASILVTGIIESAPFQKTRRKDPATTGNPVDRLSQSHAP